MGFTDWIKQGVGLAGKYALNAFGATPIGIAAKTALNWTNKNAGLIGKKLADYGPSILNEQGREQLSNVADKAIELMPKSWKLTKALNKINDAAQGRTSPSQRPRRLKRRTTNKQFQKQRQELDDRIQQRHDTMQQRQIDRLNSINHDDT